VPIAVDDVVDSVRTEVPVPPEERLIVAGVKLAVSPVGVETASVTVPVKLFRLVRVAVVVAEDPCTMLMLLGLVLIEKSGVGEALTVTEIATE